MKKPQPRVEWTVDGMDGVVVTAAACLTQDEMRDALRNALERLGPAAGSAPVQAAPTHVSHP